MPKHSSSLNLSKSDLLVLPLFANKKNDAVLKQCRVLDKAGKAQVKLALEHKDFLGKAKQSFLFYSTNKQYKRVLLLGLGNPEKLTMRRFRHAIGSSIKMAQGKKAGSINIVMPEGIFELLAEEGESETKKASRVGQACAMAVELANYIFDAHKDKEARVSRIKQVSYLLNNKKFLRGMQQGTKRGTHIAEAANHTRRLGNTPPHLLTPTKLAREAQQLARKHKSLRCKILEEKDAKKLGMECYLGVAQGSDEKPKFIILEYFGAKNKKAAPTVLAGKGITFDSGGLSLKPSVHMESMKYDMLGAATVLGILHAAAKLGLKQNIIGLMPACENMPSGSAYRPDDILTAMNGMTVRVGNTDAEGRMILADTLCYAHRYKPKQLIDFATLTGACMIALGNQRSGLFTPVDELAEKIYAAGTSVGDQLWRLPVGEEYSEAMKDDFADLNNIGGVGRPGFGGASTAAAFLEYFTLDKKGEPGYPWAHIDLSSCYSSSKGTTYLHGGANGFGVELMVEYLSGK